MKNVLGLAVPVDGTLKWQKLGPAVVLLPFQVIKKQAARQIY